MQQKKCSKKKTSQKLWLSSTEFKQVSDFLNGDTRLIFQIIVATGHRVLKIRETTWDCFNASTQTLQINRVNCKLPLATTKALFEKRVQAQSESDKIFKLSYKTIWDKTSRAYFALNIDQGPGCLKLAKYSFARRHFQEFGNKSQLARDLGLTTARFIPNAVFQNVGHKPHFIQF